MTAAPFIASRSGHVSAYRLAGIRRRGLAQSDPRYWFVEFDPKSGLGIVVDSPARLSLQRGLTTKPPGGLNWHFVRVLRNDGAIYWEGFCPITERELELAYTKIDGDTETPYDDEPNDDRLFWGDATRWIIIAAVAAWAVLYGLMAWL